MAGATNHLIGKCIRMSNSCQCRHEAEPQSRVLWYQSVLAFPASKLSQDLWSVFLKVGKVRVPICAGTLTFPTCTVVLQAISRHSSDCWGYILGKEGVVYCPARSMDETMGNVFHLAKQISCTRMYPGTAEQLHLVTSISSLGWSHY